MSAPVITASVIVIEDDPSFRRSLERLLRTEGFLVVAFGSAADFLAAPESPRPACLVLDVHLPGLNGLDLQRELMRTENLLPIVFLTGRADISMSVRAMKQGAIEFLTKPVRDEELFAAVRQGIERDRTARAEQAQKRELRKHYNTLTSREREVMRHVVAGRLNKQIASELGTTEKTVKFHRGHLMKKMRVVSVAELVRNAASLEAPTR
jgi:FixJ family two-component response regulator